MLPGELKAFSHMFMRPKVQGNFVCSRGFVMTVCFLITCSQGKLWIPTLSRSCLRVTESCKALVCSQRKGDEGVTTPGEGGYSHTDTAPTGVCDLGTGRIIYARLIPTLFPSHESLVLVGDKKLGHRDSRYSHLYVFVLRLVKKQRCYSCSDCPSFLLIFRVQWKTTARPEYIPINWCCSSVKCYFWAEVHCLVVTVWKYFVFT